VDIKGASAGDQHQTISGHEAPSLMPDLCSPRGDVHSSRQAPDRQHHTRIAVNPNHTELVSPRHRPSTPTEVHHVRMSM
jgi:hypothetical protein